MRHALYDLVERALNDAGIKKEHLDRLADRGDGVLILIRPDDDIPKTVLLNQLIPCLTAHLANYNKSLAKLEDCLRVRVVIHAGEVNDDGKGFFGRALDEAFRLLDSRRVKKELKKAAASPLVLVVSEDIYSGTVCQGHVDKESYKPFIRWRIHERLYRGWIPIPRDDDTPEAG